MICAFLVLSGCFVLFFFFPPSCSSLVTQMGSCRLPAVAAGLAFQITVPDCEIPTSPGLTAQPNPGAGRGEGEKRRSPPVTTDTRPSVLITRWGRAVCSHKPPPCTNSVVAAPALLKPQCRLTIRLILSSLLFEDIKCPD